MLSTYLSTTSPLSWSQKKKKWLLLCSSWEFLCTSLGFNMVILYTCNYTNTHWSLYFINSTFFFFSYSAVFESSQYLSIKYNTYQNNDDMADGNSRFIWKWHKLKQCDLQDKSIVLCLISINDVVSNILMMFCFNKLCYHLHIKAIISSTYSTVVLQAQRLLSAPQNHYNAQLHNYIYLYFSCLKTQVQPFTCSQT